MSAAERLISWGGLFEAALAMTLLFSTGTLFGEYHPYLEHFTHFKLQYLAGAAVLAILFAVMKRRNAMLLSIVLVMLNAWFVLPWWFGDAEPRDDALRLVHANVQSGNNEPQRFIDFVHSENPDIVIVQELTPEWVPALRALSRSYPYLHMEPDPAQFGIGFFSRLPIDTIDVVHAEPFGHLEFYVSLIAGHRRLNVVTSHPMPPVGRDHYHGRNTQLANLADAVSLLDGPTILVGDLNITMWSHLYADLEAKTGLRNARKGFGVKPTWPLFLPIGMIPIDHALVSDEIDVHRFDTGPLIGSDHLPIVVEISFGGESM